MDILYLCRPDIVCPKNQKDIPMECEHAFGLSMVQHVITKDIPQPWYISKYCLYQGYPWYMS